MEILINFFTLLLLCVKKQKIENSKKLKIAVQLSAPALTQVSLKPLALA
jgi:hypothetical protein